MLACVLASTLPAHADEGVAREAGRSLLAAASDHDIEPWLLRWVGETRTPQVGPRLAHWREVLREDGPAFRALHAARGIAWVSEGPDHHRVVLDSAPLLSLVLNEHDEIVALEHLVHPLFRATTLRRRPHRGCAPTWRAGSRLHPDLELWSAASQRLALGRDPCVPYAGRPEHRHGDLGTIVLSDTEDLVEIRYPDGTTDTWRAHWLGNRWALDYDALSPSSPLRIGPQDTRRWRRLSHRQAIARRTWRPSWAIVDHGVGRSIGHHAVGATFSADGRTVLVATQDLDRAQSALFRSIQRPRSPRPLAAARAQHRSHIAVGPWYVRWPIAIAPDRSEVLVAAERLWRVHRHRPGLVASSRRRADTSAGRRKDSPSGHPIMGA